ncbi:MAG: CHAT domain-containing protein [Okeania sp. SIO2C9]|uniref:CHAT domain-containing protein n=1 Tax=Okeania sp. SIO2C9 TaxID=2607791 RepID=UPI0013C297AD|nr:CHAT domain-containing protein [Okeania sp. SIO2C9]NEQ75446.1 CHAT domain-containing protein [Okeania sp. SIO2C9]
MKLITLHLCPLMSFVSLLGIVALPAYSQPITPANDGTGTTVNQNGNQFNIQGGTHNGTNLFHSFGKFNLNSGQTANFISTPDTRNILGRITGGDPSIINGLIQVIGGNSNLFLINPTGIIFGPNASLNIPASFSVTTATGIGFNSNNFWFQAMGTNDYSNLVGNPSGYNFNVSNPGAIVNEGNLSLNPGKDLTLTGGTVINTGELSTAGGNVTIAAVNGGDTLRISQPGHLLSLDVSPTYNNLSGQSITPILLPELLTGGDINHASSVVMNAQGNLELTDTAGVVIASGNIDVSDTSTNGSVGGQVNVLGDRVAVIDANINANGLKVGGEILIGGDFQGNGIVPNSQQTFVNNNSIISADAINNGEGGQVIIWSDKTTNFAGNISAKGGDFSGDGGFVEISGKEQLIFDGNVNVSAAFGEAGTILFDPKNIIIGVSENSNELTEQNEDDNVTFSVAEIEEIEGEITLQADNDITVNEPIEATDAIELKAGRNININADIDTSQSNSNISLFGNDNSANINNRDQGAGSINQIEGTTLNSGSGDITIRLGNLGTNGDINLANLTTTGQLLINANQGNIRQVSPNSLITANRAIFETQNSGGIGLAEAPLRIDVNNLEVLTGEQGLFINSISNLTLGGVNEELTGISTKGGGNIELNIDGNFTAIEEVVTSVPDRQPGTITISSTGNIDTTQTTLKLNSESTTGGDLFLTADGDIKTGNINASTMGNNRGGNITINSGGEVDTTAGEIFSASFDGDGGNVTITSDRNLKTGYIDSRSDGSGNGGNITLESTGGNIDTSSEELASFSVEGNGGNVSITSNGDIKTADIFSSAGEPLDAEGDLTNSSPFETNNTDSNQTQSANGSGGDITLTAEGIIDTSAGTIESFSRLGDGGSISITSKGDITTREVLSTAGDPDVGNSVDNNTTETTQTEVNSGNSGNISIESTEGAVTITAEIDTVGEAGNAGDITIKAFGDIKTESIESKTGGGEGGDITIESTNGTVDTIGTDTEAAAGIFSASIDGDAGNINITADSNLTTGNIDSTSINGQGGNITLESTNGSVDTTGGEIASKSQAGNAGNVTIKSQGDIQTGNIDSQTQAGQGGDITIESTGGSIETLGTDQDVAGIFAASEEGNAGNVTITSNGNLITGDIDSRSTNGQGGNITVESLAGNIDTSAGEVRSSSRRGNAGTVSLTSQGDIKTGSILSFAGRGTDEAEESEDLSQNESGSSNGGDITLKAGGTIDTIGDTNNESKLESFSREGSGGNISLEAKGDITTARILSTAGDPEASNPGDNSNITPLTETEINEHSSGNISIESTEGAVTTTAEINSFATSGNGGSVTIKSHGDLKTSNINSRSDVNGRGGNITLESTNGNIDTTGHAIASLSQVGNDEDVETSNDDTISELSSFSELGDAGDVTITSSGDLATGSINSRSKGSGQGGNITLDSTGGNIDTTGGDIVSRSQAGNAGSVTIKSQGDINTSNIDSQTQAGQGGDITIESTGGSIETLGTDQDVAGIFAASEEGNAGNVTITSNGNLITGNVDSRSTNGQGGKITLESTSGNIETTSGELSSFSELGNAGDVTITSSGNLITGNIDSRSDGNGKGGNITLESIGANIDTSAGEVRSSSRRGNAGTVSLTSQGNITTGSILSFAGRGTDEAEESEDLSPNESGSSNGGDITLKAGGTIDTTGETNDESKLESFSREGSGGNITLEAKGDITTAKVLSTAGDPEASNPEDNSNITPLTETEINERSSGNISIESTEGAVTTTAEINSFATSGNGGSVTIKSHGDLKTSNINSRSDVNGRGGNITLESTNGNIDTTNGDRGISSFSELGNAGDVTVTSNGNLTTSDIDSRSDGMGQGGKITLESLTGNVNSSQGRLFSFSELGNAGDVTINSSGNLTTSDIDSRSKGSGQGGNISLESLTGNIETTSGELSSFSELGNAGDVTITSSGNLTIGETNSSSKGSGLGGNITLESFTGNVDTTGGELSSFSELGNAGNVTITSNSNLTTGDINSSSKGSGRGGNITLESITGNVDTTSGELESFSRSGNAGNVTITSNGNLTTGDIFSSSGNPRDSNNDNNSSEDGSVSEANPQPTDNSNNSNPGENTGGAGGSITLIAEGEINTTVGVIESFSRRGEGGDISLEAKGNITTSEIISSAGDPENIPPARDNTENATITQSQLESETGSPGGDISIQSLEGNVTTQGELISYSNQGDGGNVSIISNGDINTAGIDSRADNRGRGGNILIQSQTGSIDTINGELASSSRTGDGGNIEIIGTGNILVETIFSESEGNGNGGDVTITGNSNIKTAAIESFAGGSGTGGNISITTDGAIDTSVGELVSSSQAGEGGNITLSATGDIITGFIESFSGAGARGGNITLETINGNIDTTVGFLGEEANIPTDADVSSEDVATTFEQELANLSSYAPEGTGGNIVIIQRGQGEITTSNISSFGGESSGDVNIINNDGNINTGVIFSTAINGTGGQISIETLNNGDLNINHIATYSAADDGTGGNIQLNASGIVNINNVASFGNAGSGDVSIESNSGSINTGTIQTRAPNGTSGNITLNTFSTQGDIRTANVSTEGGEAAGTVEIIAADGSVTTEDLQSSSESGSAGGIDVQAGEDIETGDQTVDSATGDSNINNEAGGDITTGDQTATTEEGDASINNQAGANITTGDQTATTEEGDASINNQAGANITTGDQTATTEEGDASINNQAGANITTQDQIATTEEGDASINNQAGANITTQDQTAVTNQGNASINNQAGANITTQDQTAVTNQGDASINNQAGANITTGDQIATTQQGNANINNQAAGNITTQDQITTTQQGNANTNNQAAGNITTQDQITTTQQGNANTNNQAAGNITTADQIAIGDTTNITNLPGGELNTGEIIQISPSPSIPIDNTLPQQLPQTPENSTIPGASNLTSPITPATPTNNILQSNNPISNPTTTNITQSIQSNSTISTTNNPNLPNKKSDRQQININTDTKTALQNINIINNTPLTVAANSQTLTALEQNRNNEFTDHFGEDLLTQNTSIKNIREVLTDIARETGKNSAIIYVTAYQEELQLILYTSDSDPILKTVPAAHRQQLMEVVLKLRVQITTPSRRYTQSYLPPAQKLYNWLIAPISAELEAANIDTLLFSMDEGLRTLPVAVLHDGQQFLIEKYSLSLIPSISLMNTNYRPIQDTRVLAMGASEFIKQNSLPAVPVELKTISQQLWKGTQFLNQDFTRNNLLTQRQNYPYPIVHLATHAEFRPGAISNSYIQLWGNEQLQLDQMRQLGWNDPPVELLVLSACRTAVGDKNAELGFAGLAVAAGAKSALASVWYVSDEGTLGLMTEFYTQLNNAKIKAEALRQAQLAMLRGEVVITEGQLRGTAARGAVALPSELGKFENQNLSHPYYWAGFTIVGSPW